jgi:hypothetical protein
MLMKHAILPMALFLSIPSQAALAQFADGRSREDSGNWVVSETKSPVDYSPQVSATISSTLFPGDPRISFSMYCRRGKTEAVFEISDFARYPSGSSFVVEYLAISQEAINNRSVERRWVQQRAAEQRWNELSSSIDASFTGDTVRFLNSLPDNGILSVRVRDSRGVSHDAEFHLAGLEPVREKLAAACKWPTP